MSTVRFLKKEALPEFLAWLAQGEDGNRNVLVPTKQGKSIVFAPYTGGEVCFDKASVSPKEVIFPRCETLVSYRRAKDPEDLGKTTLSLDDTPEVVPSVVFACRPCDARGFAVFDRPYTQGPYKDPYYAARREKLVVITGACTETCATCFCHWVDSGPADTEGSDILFTELADGTGYVFQGVTDKGQALLDASSLTVAEQAQNDAAQSAQKAALQGLGEAPNLSNAVERVAERFTDMDFWQKQTAHCLSCGACTYMCPTCYCFNITDEGDGLGEKSGQRLRTWDNCMASHFTREASGHNPRMLKAQRMRNRISHKFSNYPMVWNRTFSCNGCGRCISQCPVHLDIRAIVLAAVATEDK